MSAGHAFPPVTICLLGETGSGKSCSGNTILGSDAFLTEKSAAPVTTQCQSAFTSIYGTEMKVIDTPDFFDEDFKEPERHIKKCKEMCKGQACVYLLVIQIGRFTEGERDILEKLEKTLQVKDTAIILFTRGDDLRGQHIDDYVRRTNPHLQNIIRKCGDRYQVFNNNYQGGDQVKELMGKIAKLVQDTSQGKIFNKKK